MYSFAFTVYRFITIIRVLDAWEYQTVGNSKLVWVLVKQKIYVQFYYTIENKN